MSKTATKITITQKLDQLDADVDWFYGDEFKLDQAMPKFEDAIKMAKDLQKDLEELKNKVEVIGDFTKS